MLNNFPHSPAILNKFENKVKDISVGACFALFVDGKQLFKKRREVASP